MKLFGKNIRNEDYVRQHQSEHEVYSHECLPLFKRLAIFLRTTVNHMPAGDTDKNCMRGEHDDQFDWENTQN